MKVTKDRAHFKPITIVLETRNEAQALLDELKGRWLVSEMGGLYHRLNEELNGSVRPSGAVVGIVGMSGNDR